MQALKMLSHNAMRLYQDAQLLFENERYPSSLALSLLSLEESGKFLIKRKEQDNEATPYLDKLHLPKQQEALTYFIVREAILTYFEVLKEYGFEHKPYSKMTDLQTRWLHSSEGIL